MSAPTNEEAFDGLARLEWILLHAKSKDLAKVDLEREVPLLVERVRSTLRNFTESTRTVAEIMVATETERCAKVAEELAIAIIGSEKRTNSVDQHVGSILRDYAAKIRGGK